MDEELSKLIPAKTLPLGWVWNVYQDGSGYLKSPTGDEYMNFDSFSGEYCETSDSEWTSYIDLYEVLYKAREYKLQDFFDYAESIVAEKYLENQQELVDVNLEWYKENKYKLKLKERALLIMAYASIDDNIDRIVTDKEFKIISKKAIDTYLKADVKALDLLAIVDFLCVGYTNNRITLEEINEYPCKDIANAVIDDCYETLKYEEKCNVFDDDDLSL